MVSRSTLKERIFNYYITQRNYFAKGYGEFSFLKGLIEFVFVISIYLEVKAGYSFPYSILILLIVFIVGFLWSVGYIWDRLHLFHLETEWANKRNPFVEEWRKKKRFK